MSVPYAYECQCEGARRERDLREAMRHLPEVTARWRSGMIGTGMPRHLLGITPNYEMGHLIGRDSGMLFVGRSGTYKTTTACAVALGYIAEHLPHYVRYVNVTDMLSSVKATYGRGGDTEDDLIRRWSEVPLLVLDDLGKGKMGEWAVGVIYAVVNRRYESGNPMIVTTQYSMSELGERISASDDLQSAEALVRRIGEKCRRYDFDKGYERMRERYAGEFASVDERWL